MKQFTMVMIVAAFGIVSPAMAAFIETFDGAGYVAGSALPAPWAASAHNAGGGNPVLVSASPTGFGGTQGAHGPGPSWFESDMASGYNPLVLSYDFSWKARTDSANGLGRVSAGVGNAAGGIIFWEMRNTSPAGGVIEFPRTGSSEVSAGGWTTVPIVSETWYQMSVRLFNDGLGNWTWTGQYADSPDDITFNPALPMGSGILPAGWAPSTIGLASIVAFNEVGGTSALDDVSFQGMK